MDFNEFEKAMVESAAKDSISEVNWSSFPYCPETSFHIARSESHIAIYYHVTGLDLRAESLEDNGPVWEDSCCEFFIAHPSDGTYYNFEMNCIGTLLAAKRTSRENKTMLSQDQLDRIKRFHSLERKRYDKSGEIHSWSLAMLIPFGLIGMDGTALPSVSRANFYKCGDKTAHPHYCSWERIECERPDFHRPDFFGELLY